MKEKIEEAIKKCLEENGYHVRGVFIESKYPQDFDRDMINYNDRIKIRAEKK